MPGLGCRRALVLSLVLLLPVLAATKPAKKKSKTPAVPVARVLLQMERDWSQAGMRKDGKTIDRILADDWVSIDFHGKRVTKAQAMAELASTPAAPPSIELGEMKVRVMGATAIVTCTDRSGQYAWMDVFMKRDGHWQAVASQSTRVEK
jgi:ketosteroid isomerase-like protein